MADFQDLPIEIIRMIAREITDDADLETFRCICMHNNNCVEGDNGSFWSQRFFDSYDSPSTHRRLSHLEYKRLYIRRQGRLDVHVQSKNGKPGHERRCLETLAELIAESFTILGNKGVSPYESRNMVVVHNFAEKHGLLGQAPRKRRTNGRGSNAQSDTLLYTVQLALTHLSLTGLRKPPSKGNSGKHGLTFGLSFPDSQQMAYLSQSMRPLFNRYGEVDVEWALHVVNFFKHHFLRAGEQLVDVYRDLDGSQKPQRWSSTLQHGPQKLGKHWKGSYTFVDPDEIHAIRAGRNDDDSPIQDQVNGEQDADGFQSLVLGFPQSESMHWPDSFEYILRSRNQALVRPRTRAQRQISGFTDVPADAPISFQFRAEGKDNATPFHAAGWLNPLPPQQGIPGWQRLTMMKYYVDDDDEDTSPMAAQEDSLWAYEGVVLPGGKIVVGRWWYPDFHVLERDFYSGPFILWNVDGSKVEESG